ncbi:MlaD family protein [Patulibacter sp.]|uniref:MlaD family protein n=1 Tax=Patulibacter sp. TaxID=1912859 RepID=UPI0027240DEB|nr:MlaD family protein [Patulibacter sp.]MDO9408709.1 MlaD family protein [Patulibacter sp.]
MRALRRHRRWVAVVALDVVLVAIVAVVVLGPQRIAFPSWLPGGEDRVRFTAVFSADPSLTPGQGQTVTIAGIDVGDITDVAVRDGKAKVGFRLRPKYAAMVRRDASALLRPKTGQDDVVLELDPGTPASPRVGEGSTIAESRTTADVDPDEILASLDVDTRSALQLLLQTTRAGVGSKDRAADLAAALRRTGPVARNLRRVGEALDGRAADTRRAVRSLRLISDELGRGRSDVVAAVRTTDGVVGTVAGRSAELRAALRELPATLRTTRTALADTAGLAAELPAATTALRPVTRSLAPALRSTRPFLRDTTPVIDDRLLPLTRRTLPTVRRLRTAVASVNDVAPDATATLRELNVAGNLLAYDPPGDEQGYLFWAQWLSHLAPWIFNTQDADGPIRRGRLLVTCDTLKDVAGVGAVSPVAGLLQGVFGGLARAGSCPVGPGGAADPTTTRGGGR